MLAGFSDKDSELAPLEYKSEVLLLSQLAQFWFRLMMSEVEYFYAIVIVV
jgi:hypothetical protein